MTKLISAVTASILVLAPLVAQASVCIMTAQVPDDSYTVWCDGKNVSEQQSASVLLQEYLTKGYKIAGQSEANGLVVWTLVK